MMICATIVILCVIAIIIIIVLKIAAKKALITVIKEANGRIFSDDFKNGLKKHPLSLLKYHLNVRDMLTNIALSLGFIVLPFAWVIGFRIASAPYYSLEKERKKIAETAIITQKADYEAIEDFNRRVDELYADRTAFEKAFYLLGIQTKIEGEPCELYINVKE